MEPVDQPTSIENLSESDLRREIVTGINDTLGKLANGPVADGTGTYGYNRKSGWSEKIEPGDKSMLPLICSYARFTKAYERDKQVGVRLELLGLMESGSMYVNLKPMLDKQAQEVARMNPEQLAEFEKFTQEMKSLKVAIEQDGLAPADNRYYFIPLDPIQPAIVSTESSISRAYRANPQEAERVLLPEVIADAQEEQTAPIEPISGQPRWKIANLQDLRDIATIVRGYKGSIKEIIQQTPAKHWGRPGLTD